MLTESVKAPLKSVLLPVPLTVMKKTHKDNLQNSTSNANWMHVKCRQLLLMAYQRSEDMSYQFTKLLK